jgi:hypothetical protein
MATIGSKGQPGTDFGSKGESGEKFPKGAKSSDAGGERSARIKNGVGMGSADVTGGRAAGSKEVGELNTGRSESICYDHKRIPHAQGK